MLQLVDADDPVVADLLLGTVELVLQSGGWVHPGIRFVERAGQLSVQCAQPDDRPLVRIPRETFVRVDTVTWGPDDDRLVIEALPDDIGEAELPMLYLQTALHNQCGKLDWLRRTHPAIASLPDHLVNGVQAIEPGFRRRDMSATDLLFSNRCFRVSMDDGAAPQRVLIPLLDLLNHQHGGAMADWDGLAFSAMPRTRIDSIECVLDYGLQRDALELALVYGFVDDSVTWVHSAPIDIEIDGVGRVIVTRDHRAPDGSLQPVHLEHAPHATRINRLTFGPSGKQAVARDLTKTREWTRDQANHVVGVVIEENRRLLESLVQLSPLDNVTGAAIRSAAARSLEILAQPSS